MARNGNTSNVKAHLKNNHKSCILRAKATEAAINFQHSKVKQSTYYINIFHPKPTLQPSSKNWKELNDAVAYHICTDRLPIYTVEKKGFRSMIKTLHSWYELPSHVHFSGSVVLNLYASTKQKAAKQLAGVKFFAAATIMWSSIGLRLYMSYKLHYIDKKFTFQSLSLSTCLLPQDHTASILGDALSETLEEWNLHPAQQVCLTTNSGANKLAAARNLKWTCISCFGHNLHLPIMKATDKDGRCAQALGVARKIVSAFSYSWKRRRELTRAQISLDIPKHSLVTVSTYIILH